MDPIDSGQGQENPSEQNSDLTPSSRGRPRKKNPKYQDYETEDLIDEKKTTGRKSSGEGAASKRTPAKRRKAEDDPEPPQGDDVENEANHKTPQELDEITAKETPKKAVRAKKTPTKRTPGRKKKSDTANTDVALPHLEGGAADSAQQENGTPKPKRKYVKKQRAQVIVEPPPCASEPEEEIQPGGRRRRGAAKAALKYLHNLAKEALAHPGDETASQPGADSDVASTEPDPKEKGKRLKGSKGRPGRKRKRRDSDGDAAEDEDFVPDAEEMEAEEINDEEEEEEEEEEGVDSDFDLRTFVKSPATSYFNKTKSCNVRKRTPNGLSGLMMMPVTESAESTKKFRETHYSSWVFPEWIPSSNSWHPVPQSDLEKYLPQELQSAAFKVSREGLRPEQSPLQRLRRLTAVPADPDRWDMLLYAGGPVWALEWCPTPDGAPASQFIALACHRGMDDKHCFNKTYTKHGLVQLWGFGSLECNSRPDSSPAFTYGLAQDKGFIWHLKWCPAGGWEPHNSDRKAPFLPRLGLLAVSTSNSVVTIYSLPHPEALLSIKKPANCGKDHQQFPIYKVKEVLSLKLGSFRAPRHEKCGQVLSMDWLPEKPHNIIAIGFYDGVVGLWDLTTKSGLLRVRESDASLSLLPYRCLRAHDHAVRALVFCPASRYLLVTAGEDRYVKTWDLRRLHDPITAQKRFLTNEICWPLNAPGILWAQDNAYAASGSQGVHYFDHQMRTIFAIPRTASVWSISYTDWLNGLVTSDGLGDVIFALLPYMSNSPHYLKRTKERRFPVYLTSMLPFDTNEELVQETNKEKVGVEEEGDAAEEQEGGAAERVNGSEGGNENNKEPGRGGGRVNNKDTNPPLQSHLYNEVAEKYFLHLTDNNMLTFLGSEKRPVWKRMVATEGKSKLNLDEMTLAALHKVRFNPNLLNHTWLATGGQSGLVRLNNLRGMISSQTKKMLSESRAKFSTLCSAKKQKEAEQTEREEL
ncbi:general transcription factor 3C polypeptide 2 [Labrus bergylta]|uniref:general transcription factor 3C polypeptide 2 n=1 Tax=Labrus bergylta TaxID=56723 RepID=UPI0033134139